MAMKSMVEVFNQLTHHELADFSLFEDLLGNHYEKFRYYYDMTVNVSSELTDTVEGVSCFCVEAGITIVTVFDTEEHCQEYLNELESDDESFDEYFSFDVEITGGKTLNISIENKNISGEDEIYEDRFNSN